MPGQVCIQPSGPEVDEGQQEDSSSPEGDAIMRTIAEAARGAG